MGTAVTTEQFLALFVFLAVTGTVAWLIVHYIVMPLRHRMMENQRRAELEVARAMYKRDMRILRDILDEEGER